MRGDIMSKKRNFKVEVWEYERDWGSKLDFTNYYDTYSKAEAFIEKFNSSNTDKKVPDWYMVAKGPYINR